MKKRITAALTALVLLISIPIITGPANAALIDELPRDAASMFAEKLTEALEASEFCNADIWEMDESPMLVISEWDLLSGWVYENGGLSYFNLTPHISPDTVIGNAYQLLSDLNAAAAAPLYGLPNVLSAEDPEIIGTIEDVMEIPIGDVVFACYYPDYYTGPNFFDVERLSNEDLFGMAQSYYFPYGGGLMGEDIVLKDGDATHCEIRALTYEQVNDFMLRNFGKAVDFTPYEVDELPEAQGYIDVFKFYAWNGYFCKEPAYTSYGFYSVKILQLVDIGKGFYAAELHVSSSDEGYYEDYGTTVAILEKTGGYFRVKKIYPFGEVPELSAAKQYAVTAQPESDFVIDYEALSGTKTLSDFAKALRDALDGRLAVNDAGNSDITTFMEYAIQRSGALAVRAKDNKTSLSSGKLGLIQKAALEARETLCAELGGITLQRAPVMNARIDVRGLDLDAPVEISIDEEGIAALSEMDTVTILLEDGRHGLTADLSDLQRLGELRVRIAPEQGGAFRIAFLDSDGNELEEIGASLAVSLPASDAFASVHATIGGRGENWGGQYDPINGSITFRTGFSGTYTVLQMSEEISDIGMLDEEQQNAIRFMVAKGILEMRSGGKFSPGSDMTRYQFAKALVKIFFALDPDAACSFTDVSSDSPYYPYLASGQKEGIVNGYDDGTYRGEEHALRWHIIAFCARTLANKKGYSAPEDPSLYLNFVDTDLLLDTCNDADTASVALAVREGLVPNGGVLRPDLPVTKGDAALILYRLYMLLYESSPAEIVMGEAEEELEEDAETPAPSEKPDEAGVDSAEDDSAEPDREPLPAKTVVLIVLAAVAVLSAALTAAAILILKRRK